MLDTLSGHASSPASRPGLGLQAVAARWREVEAWWCDGARATVPPRWIAAFSGRRRPTFVLSRAGGAWACLRIEGDRAEALDFGPAGFTLSRDARVVPRISASFPCSDKQGGVGEPTPPCLAGLAAWLAERGLGRGDIRLALALERDDLFLRTMTLPEAALSRLDEILAQEVVRRTPFEPGEIWHGGQVLPGSGPVRRVRHWIVRRDFVRRALASLGLDEGAVDAVAVASDGGLPIPVIPLRTDGAPVGRQGRTRLLKALGAVALIVTVLALASADGVERLRAARVSDVLAAMRFETESGATGGRDLKALMAIKALPGLGTAWAELSRILPDDTFVTELRLDDGSFTIQGFSGNAASLVRIVDASPLFTTAALTAGIEPNAGAGRDQFALSFDLRARPPRKGRPAVGLPR